MSSSRCADEIAMSLIGNKYGRLTVTGFVGTNRQRQRLVSATCECGSVQIYPAMDIYMGRRTECMMCKMSASALRRWGKIPRLRAHQPDSDKPRKPKKRDQLCWDCRNSTSKYRCSWAEGIPRSDWDADKKVTEVDDGRQIISYEIKHCPAFERG